MTKFRVTDPVRVIAAPCRYHDLTGIVGAIIVDGPRNPYRVDGLEPWPLWFGADELVLAEMPTGDAPGGAGEANGAGSNSRTGESE